jgi:hypothetical protein
MVKPEKPKREMTPERLEQLAAAREKARETLRLKQLARGKETKATAAEKKAKAERRIEAADARLAALEIPYEDAMEALPAAEPVKGVEPTPPPAEKNAPKKKAPKKRAVVYEDEEEEEESDGSEADDEYEEVIVRRRRPKRGLVRSESRAPAVVVDTERERLMRTLFG